MLVTNYEIEVPVNDTKFVVTYTPLSFDQLQKLNKEKEDAADANKPIEIIRDQMLYKRDKAEINNSELDTIKELLRDAKDQEKRELLKEKRELLQEQKELINEIEKLSKELGKETKDKPKTPFVNWGEKKFDLCVSGKDVTPFKELIKKGGITYSQVLKTIEEMVSEKSEKKSTE